MLQHENEEYRDEGGELDGALYSDFSDEPGDDLPENKSTIERVNATFRSMTQEEYEKKFKGYRPRAAQKLNARPGVAKDAYRRVRTIRKSTNEGSARAAASTNLRGEAALKQHATQGHSPPFVRGGGSVGIKTTGRAAARFLIMPAVFAYGAQLVLGLIAFGLVGVHVVIQEMKSGGGVVATVTGWLLEAGKTVVGWFADIPGFDEMGMFFWFFAFLVALCVFLGYMLFFHFVGISFLDSILSFVVLFICITLCYVIPIFPGALIWVVVVIGADTVKTARGIAGV